MLALFALLGMGGLFCLSTGCMEEERTVSVVSPTVIWGPPLGNGQIQTLIQKKKSEGSAGALQKTSYIEKNPDTLYSDLLEAIAVNSGPDAVVIDASMLLPLTDKISVRTYESFPLLTFQQTYIEGAEVFAQESGIFAYPLMVDPLVLYWNRDLFTNAGIAQVPQDWTTFMSAVPRLTIKENGADLKQSAIAFGEHENVLHAKEILSALLFQSGASIVSRADGKYKTDLARSESTGASARPEVAVSFYTSFSNPRKDVYTWNKTFERSREAFAANKVVMYVGYASEAEILNKINPNLNYAVAVLPQSATGKNRATYGKFYGVAVLKTGKSQVTAHTVAQTLASKEYAQPLVDATGLPTARRDSLTEVPDDPLMSIAVRSALIARDWPQPDPRGIDDSLRVMIEAIANGQSPESALLDVAGDVQAMLARYNKQ